MNKTFNDIYFWRFYKLVENSDLEGEQIDQFLSDLGKDYTVTELSDEDGSYFNIAITIPAGKNYNLKIVFSIEEETKHVYLIDRQTNEEFMLGWWDQQRWHPYFIHWDEWQLLLQYWNKSRQDVDLINVLLNDFVGATGSQQAEIVNTEKSVFKKWGIDCDELYGNSHFEKERFISIEEEHFKWQKDDGLGWVFAGEHYTCYSTRNQEHLNGKEDFPFVQWNKMIKELN